MRVFECPHCGRSFRAVPAVMGRTIRCRRCERAFVVPVDGRQAAPGVATAAAKEIAASGVFEGTAVRSCPTCGHTFAMQPRLAGKAIRCRKCRGTFRVLHEEERVPPAEGARPAEDVQNGASDVVSERGSTAADRDDEPMGMPVEATFPPRPNRRFSSGGFGGDGELIAVLMGGLLALPISQIIFWWGLGWDPFGVARKLRPELQWLAPEHLVADAPDTK
jgi:DNA-directed RNA polymerase subunit RPC12/RpoP